MAASSNTRAPRPRWTWPRSHWTRTGPSATTSRRRSRSATRCGSMRCTAPAAWPAASTASWEVLPSTRPARARAAWMSVSVYASPTTTPKLRCAAGCSPSSMTTARPPWTCPRRTSATPRAGKRWTTRPRSRCGRKISPTPAAGPWPATLPTPRPWWSCARPWSRPATSWPPAKGSKPPRSTAAARARPGSTTAPRHRPTPSCRPASWCGTARSPTVTTCTATWARARSST